MAVIRCPECGKEISDKATACIHCGNPLADAPTAASRKMKPVWLIIVLLMLILVLLLNLVNQNKDRCLVSGCRNEVYSNGFCFDHYAQNKKERITTDPPEVSISEVAEKEVIEIDKNQCVSTEGICAFTVKSYSISKTVSPPNPADYYTYFTAPNGSKFVDVQMDIKSLYSNPVAQNSLLDSVKIVYDNEYEYYCSPAVEIKNGGDLDRFTSIHGINPLETMRYHMICEIPESVLNQGKTMSVVIEASDRVYSYKLR